MRHYAAIILWIHSVSNHIVTVHIYDILTWKYNDTSSTTLALRMRYLTTCHCVHTHDERLRLVADRGCYITLLNIYSMS